MIDKVSNIQTHKIAQSNNIDSMANYKDTFLRPDILGDSFWIKQPA